MEKPFIFHSKPNETGIRVTVLGYYTEGVLNLSAARCSEKDRFVRKTGVEIAFARYNKKEYVTFYQTKEMTYGKFIAAAEAVEDSVIAFGVDTKIELHEMTGFSYSLKD
jgi:hypothetical protein